VRWLARLSVLLLFSGAASAAAQEEERPNADTTDTAASDQSAQEVFGLGRQAMEDGRFTEAARYFERAYELSPRPELLYNIGMAHERANQPEQAIAFFERYLASGEDVQRRTEVDERLRVLRATADEGEGEPGEPAVTTEQAEPSGRSVLGPVIVMGTGVALLGAGIVFLGLASSSANTVTAAAGMDVYWDTVAGDAADAETFSALGAVFLGVGAAAIVGGVVWLIAGGGDDEEDIAVSIAPNGALVRGRF